MVDLKRAKKGEYARADTTNQNLPSACMADVYGMCLFLLFADSLCSVGGRINWRHSRRDRCKSREMSPHRESDTLVCDENMAFCSAQPKVVA